jgi:hypothetical protein
VIYRCCDQERKDKVAQDPALTGIDYLEVVDGDLPQTDPLRQRTLLVHCLEPLSAVAGSCLTGSNVRITGGERIRNITVEWAAPAKLPPPRLGDPAEAATKAVVDALADAANVLVVRTGEAGDFSTYTLALVTSPVDPAPPADSGRKFDVQLSAIDFSFKVECPSDLDCKPAPVCERPAQTPPDIDYLAKDYASFRRLLLDRMAQLVPQWQQSSEADFGVAAVEALAYIGDQLSYEQDAVATEAYLETARRRISLRRHALLVDYAMHDGCNARVWVQLQVAAASCTLPLAGTQFLTRCAGIAPGIEAGSDAYRSAMLQSPTVFEPLRDPRYAPGYLRPLHSAHNRIPFYTWGDRHCCLPRGATSATLAGSFPDLHVGDVLLLEEVLGPQTGAPGDADPSHRHVVRLTRVQPASAPPALTDALTGAQITEIEWAPADALPFALCVSSVSDEAHGSAYLADVSVARGNLILADHGRTLASEALGTVPAPTLFSAPACSADFCAPSAPVPIPVRFRPRLAEGPLTQAGTVLAKNGDGTRKHLPFDPAAPARSAMTWKMADVLPQISLESVLEGRTSAWQVRRTLLESGFEATDFVAEVDDDGIAWLRFGDGEYGLRPRTGAAFAATYRIGNGAAGNVGAETIAHIVAGAGDLANIAGTENPVRNPLPAEGGVDAEPSETVRRNAPEAFRGLERAVTTDDYAEVTGWYAGVQRAAATLRWTGSWYTVFIAVDPDAGVDPGSLRQQLPAFVDAYRMAGHDLEFDDPHYVSLEIRLHVCVDADHFRGDVEAGLLEVLGNRVLPDGRRGLFHPDNFTFGQTVYLSPLYAAAHAVPGVDSVQVTKFQRQGDDDPVPLAAGKMPLSRLEIARLDNDPNFPEHGVLRLELHGGK